MFIYQSINPYVGKIITFLQNCVRTDLNRCSVGPASKLELEYLAVLEYIGNITERICQTGERKKKRGLIMSSIIDNISRCQAINVETIDYDSKTTHILVSM